MKSEKDQTARDMARRVNQGAPPGIPGLFVNAKNYLYDTAIDVTQVASPVFLGGFSCTAPNGPPSSLLVYFDFDVHIDSSAVPDGELVVQMVVESSGGDLIDTIPVVTTTPVDALSASYQAALPIYSASYTSIVVKFMATTTDATGHAYSVSRPAFHIIGNVTNIVQIPV